MSDPIRPLVRRIKALEDALRKANRTPQLPSSSMEGGAITVYQPGTGGVPGAVVGEQFDGSYGAVPVAGPTPPTPTGITMESVLGGVRVRWDGTFIQTAEDRAAGRPTVAPQDWSRAEVHISPDVNLSGLLFDTLRGTIESPRGGDVITPYASDVPLYARLVARSTSGKPGAASAVIGPVLPGKVTQPDLDFDIADLGGTTVYYGPATPTAGAYGDLWLKEVDPGPPAQYETYRWTPGSSDSWELLADQGVTQALLDAAAAQTKADQADQKGIDALVASGNAQSAADAAAASAANAQSAANQAIADAADAQASADGKVTTYFATTGPTGLTAADSGDLWFDTDDGNRLYRWSGTAWVVAADQRIAQAITDAQNAGTKADLAKATADGKIVTFYQAAPPTATAVGDLWVDTDDGNRLYRWSGSAWINVQDAAIQAAASLAQTAKNEADRKVVVYRQTAAPTGLTAADTNDLWLDTDDSNKLYAWSGTAWVLSDDQRIATALTTAQGKTTVFAQDDAPVTTGRVNGDLWIDTNDGNKQYVWNGAWTPRTFGAAAIAATARQLGAITTYRQATAPTGAIIGDFWIDSDDNKLYRWEGSPTPTWVLVQDADIQAAIADAATAQATADGKVRIWTQPTQPVETPDLGDLWIDTDDGNRVYVWQTSTTVQRTNLAINPSFEYDPAGAIPAGGITGWTSFTNGTVGTITRSIVTTGGVANRTQAARAVSSSQAAGNGAGFGWLQTFPAVPGDVFRVSAVYTLTVTDANKVPYIRIRYLDATGTVIGTSDNSSGNGTITTSQTVVATGAAAPAGTASVDVTLMRRSNGTGVALANSDFTVDSVLIEKNRPADAPTGYFDGTSGGEAAWTGTAEMSTSRTFQEGTAGAAGWKPRLLRTSAFQPNSIVAKDVIATGTVSAALLEAVLVLVNTLIAGTVGGARVQIDANGISQVEADGSVTFQLQPGGSTYFAGVLTGRSANYDADPATPDDHAGWIVGEDGDAAFQTVQVYDSLSAASISASKLNVGGKFLDEFLDSRPRGLIAQGFDTTVDLQGVVSEKGIVELGFLADPGRGYLIDINGPVYASSDADTWMSFFCSATMDGSAPAWNSPRIANLGDREGGPDNPPTNTSWPWRVLQAHFLWYPDAPVPQTQVRLLLSFNRTRGTGTVGVNATQWRVQMSVYDMGPALPNSIRINGTSATSPPPPPPKPVQSHTETFYATAGASYRADGSRWSVNEQGWAYQGFGDSFNGNQMSMQFFDANYIRSRIGAGTIKSATFYARNGHTWNYGGGTLILGSHNHASMPATAPGTGVVMDRSRTTHAKGAWVGVDCLGIMNEIKANTTQGLTFGRAPDNSNGWYGYYYQYPHADRPRILCTWEV